MKDNINYFIKAVLAGIYITIAAAVYLYVLNTTGNKVLASLLFSIGLLVIVSRGYYLYTGKVGYLLPHKKGTLTMVGITLLGNFIGIIIMGLLINGANIEIVNNEAVKIVNTKFSNQWYSILILSYFCGILMYTGVDGYTHIKSDISKNVIVVLAVVTFLVLGFEHSIANIAYIVFSKSVTFKQIGLLLLMVIGNGLGGISINLLHSYIKE